MLVYIYSTEYILSLLKLQENVIKDVLTLWLPPSILLASITIVEDKLDFVTLRSLFNLSYEDEFCVSEMVLFPLSSSLPCV